MWSQPAEVTASGLSTSLSKNALPNVGSTQYRPSAACGITSNRHGKAEPSRKSECCTRTAKFWKKLPIQLKIGMLCGMLGMSRVFYQLPLQLEAAHDAAPHGRPSPWPS